MRLPTGLEWWRGEPYGGAEWLDRLPRLIDESAEQWSLSLEPAFEPAHISFVAPASLPDGSRAILKVNFPDEESEHEADALAHWGGRGAVRLLAHDPERGALLLERCEPGTRLWEIEDEREANSIAAGVLRRLWRPAEPTHGFRLLEREAERWAVELPERWERLEGAFERSLVDRAVALIEELAHSQEEAVVLHQDFHGGNVLRAEREPWLVIDPNPLVGERAFEAASLLRDRREELIRDPDPVARVRRRLDQLADELELDRERMRCWGVVHAVEWGVTNLGYVDELVLACARWLAAA